MSKLNNEVELQNVVARPIVHIGTVHGNIVTAAQQLGNADAGNIQQLPQRRSS